MSLNPGNAGLPPGTSEAGREPGAPGLRPGYKQTEVGVIPEDWEVKPLGDLLNKGRLGGNYPNQLAPSNFPLMKMGNLQRGEFDVSKVEFIKSGVVPESIHRLRHGDVLFNTRNTLDLVGKVAMWRDELPEAYYNSNLMRLEFEPNEICAPAYANAALNSSSSITLLRGMATGTTSVAAIYTRDLMGLPVAKAPLPEQRAIAEALSDVDGLLVGLDRLIAKKRDLKQAAMQQLLTAQTRLPGFHGEWVTKPFGDLVAPRRDRVDPRFDGPFEFCVELEHISSATGSLLGHTAANEVASLKSVFSRGDVLFGKLRAYLRKFWKADRNGVCSTEIWVLRPKDGQLLPSFLYHLVGTDDFVEAASNSYGTHMPRSDWSVVSELDISLPPTPAEQTAIAEVLDEMDRELTAVERRREKTRALKQAMMQQLLTGQTRLV